MGLISKLSGASKNDHHHQQADNQAAALRQHPIGAGKPGVGITGGTALNDHGRDGSNTVVSSTAPANTIASSTVPANTVNNNIASSSLPAKPTSSSVDDPQTTTIPDRTRGESYTTSLLRNIPGHYSPGEPVTTNSPHVVPTTPSNTADHNVPRQPFDPFTSKGQQIAANAASDRNTSAPGATYGASDNRGPVGDAGSRRDHDDPAVQRTHTDGTSNQPDFLKTGPHSELENRDAVPTARGRKLGTDVGYESTGHDSSNQQQLASSPTTGPHSSNLLNKLDPRVDSQEHTTHAPRHSPQSSVPPSTYGQQSAGNAEQNPHQQQQHSHDAGMVGAGVASHAAHNHRQDVQYGQHQPVDQPLAQSSDSAHRHSAASTTVNGATFGQSGQQTVSTTGGETKAGWDVAKRLGGAFGAGYEAGYRDALAHAEADRSATR